MLTISKNKQKIGIVYLGLALTMAVWLGSKWAVGDGFDNLWKYPAKVASLCATMLMCWAVILSARVRPLENYFRGLDKIYQLHKRIGRWAFYAVLVHPVCLYIDRLPNVVAFVRDMLPASPFASAYLLGQTMGVVSLGIVGALMTLTLWRKPPYHVWKRSHEWFGLALLLVMAHVWFVDADVSRYPVLTVWVWGWMLLALAAFVYIRFLYRFAGPKFVYRLTHVERHADILEMTFAPVGPQMDFRPSQFVYLVVDRPGITPEPHPYSIASGYNLGGRFKLGIKEAGDHTRTLSALGPGDEVTVYGPYGRFSDAFLTRERDCVFIGAGIGITPFIGMWHVALHAEDRLDEADVPGELRKLHPEIIRTWHSPRIALFYVCPTRKQASFDYDLQREVILSRFHGMAALEKRGHRYELYESKREGRFTAQYALENVPDLLQRNVFLCGPTAMVEALSQQFLEMGVPETQIVIEDFNLL